jgi:hypothetical protein
MSKTQLAMHVAGVVVAYLISLGLAELYGSPCASIGCDQLLKYTFMPVHEWWSQLYSYKYNQNSADFYMSFMFYSFNIMIFIWVMIIIADFKKIYLRGLLAQPYSRFFKTIGCFVILFLLFYFIGNFYTDILK